MIRFEIFTTPTTAPDTEEMNTQPWRWRMRDIDNGRIVADGSEGYASEGNVRRAVAMIQDAILSAEGEMDVVLVTE